jgi:hypothetical protein|tara:strand:- start:31 stop:342 length:312 start_codon:yes stop_codon:yes gene_type:complete
MARKPNSLTLIEDPSMEPYFITKDEHCYTVNRKVTSNANHFRSTGKSTTYSKAVTFHAKFEDALKRITEEQLHTKEHYTNLTDFLSHFTKIESNIKNYLHEKA